VMLKVNGDCLTRCNSGTQDDMEEPGGIGFAGYSGASPSDRNTGVRNGLLLSRVSILPEDRAPQRDRRNRRRMRPGDGDQNDTRGEAENKNEGNTNEDLLCPSHPHTLGEIL
jgi:hypothetical protein